jgi:hypothetical protein
MEEKMETNHSDLETVVEDNENSDIQIIDDDQDDQDDHVVDIDDPTEIEGKTSNEYKENSWPKHPEVPREDTLSRGKHDYLLLLSIKPNLNCVRGLKKNPMTVNSKSLMSEVMVERHN